MLVDTHCHLEAAALAPVAGTLGRALRAGVERVVAVGSDPASNAAVLDLAARHPEVWPALGFHPERLDLTDGALEEVEGQALAARSRLAALGEVGLPWYALAARPDRADLLARGRRRLGRLLALARRLGLPVSLHAPHGVAADALALVDRAGAGPVVFHWHKADPEVTRAIVSRGHLVGVTPAVLYRERDRALVRAVPLGSIVLESDGPWLYEAGAEPGSEGVTGEPALVARVAREVAQLVQRPITEVLAILADTVTARLRGGGAEATARKVEPGPRSHSGAPPGAREGGA
jgi:TatD DNase family protein